MKAIASIFLLLFLISCSQQKSEEREIYYRDGVAYEKFSNKPFSGTIYVKDSSGNITIQCTFKDGKEDGIFKSYYPNKVTESEVIYQNGKEEGNFKSYYQDGSIKEEGSYKNGEESGVFIEYHQNGNIKSEINYNNGVKDGEEIHYFPSGRERAFFHNKDGKIQGTFVKHNENGKIISIENFNNGEKNGIQTYFNLNEEFSKVITNFKNGQKEGTEIFFDKEERVIVENNYHLGLPFGEQKQMEYFKSSDEELRKKLKYQQLKFVIEIKKIETEAVISYGADGSIEDISFRNLGNSYGVLDESSEWKTIPSIDEYYHLMEDLKNASK